VAEMVTYHLEKMSGRMIIIGHGDLTPPEFEGGESLLITKLQLQTNRFQHFLTAEDVGKIL
jgi:hypothetical protein